MHWTLWTMQEVIRFIKTKSHKNKNEWWKIKFISQSWNNFKVCDLNSKDGNCHILPMDIKDIDRLNRNGDC